MRLLKQTGPQEENTKRIVGAILSGYYLGIN